MNWDRILKPEILALSIPIVAILVWGLKSIISALAGQPDNFENWKQELENLRTRVDCLEEANRTKGQNVR